jgi:diaminobutyrate-2-oxoglutarate transaminase
MASRDSSARTYSRDLPIVLSHAEGIHVTDADGRRYLDCLAGAGSLALGHNHPVVVDAIRRVLDDRAPMHGLDLRTPVRDDFVESLFACLPPALAADGRIHFCGPTGADAVEAALKLAKTATGRRGVLAFTGGYHGMTAGAMSVTGDTGPRAPVAGVAADVTFLPYPYAYRCPFGLGGDAGAVVAARYAERRLDDPCGGALPPAAMILELVQGEGGVVPAPDRWAQQMRRITAERGIPLVVDEVQTGLGRTGALWACEHAGITPDVLVLSKAIGGGLPLAVVVYRAGLDRWARGAHTGTFRGHQLAMAAGAATIRYAVAEGLPAHAAAMGARLVARLRDLQRVTACIGEVRGRGLMLGLEIVEPGRDPDLLGSLPPAPRLARAIQAEALAAGLLVERGGRHGAVVRLLPPLTVTAAQVDEIADRLAAAVRAAERDTAGRTLAPL